MATLNLSLKEKSLIVSLVITLIVFGNYFAGVLESIASKPVDQPGITAIIGVVILVVILEAIIHAFLYQANQNETDDERDKLVERMSYRNAYWFLCAGVWFVIVQVFLDSGFRPIIGLTATPFGLANLILFIFIISEIVMFITQLYYYRRGFQ